MEIFTPRVQLYFFSCFFFSDASAQQPLSVSSANSPLSDILENVSENYGIRFAYDAAAFSDIKASVTLQNVQIEEFLQHLLIHFNVVSKQLDGTWLLLLQYPEIQIQHEEAKP
jgi:hypothetical protein